MGMASSHQPDESSPLLAESRANGPERPQSSSPLPPDAKLDRNYWKTVILTGAFIVLYQVADVLRFAPSIRLYELGYCRRYWAEHNPTVIDHNGFVPEELCKHRSIQGSLSGLRAWLGTIEGLMGLIFVLPYGYLADKKGGPFVAALNLFGYVLSGTWILIVSYYWRVFPIEAVVLSPVFRVIGGGSPVVAAVLLAILAKAAPVSQRSTIFFWMGAAELTTEAAAPFLAACLLDHGFLYLPIVLGYPLELLALLVLYLMPPSAPANKSDNSSPETPSAQSAAPPTPSQKLRLGACLLVFMFAKFGRAMLEMLVQYTSQRFDWSLAKASTLLSARAFANIALLLLLLPVCKHLFQRYKPSYSANVVDLRIAQASTILLAAGCLTLGLAKTVPVLVYGLLVFTAGSGARQALQSYLTSFVARPGIARLYTLVALADGLGSLLGAAVLNGALRAALRRGGTLLGLPFFIAAGLYGIGIVLLLFV